MTPVISAAFFCRRWGGGRCCRLTVGVRKPGAGFLHLLRPLPEGASLPHLCLQRQHRVTEAWRADIHSLPHLPLFKALVGPFSHSWLPPDRTLSCSLQTPASRPE